MISSIFCPLANANFSLKISKESKIWNNWVLIMKLRSKWKTYYPYRKMKKNPWLWKSRSRRCGFQELKKKFLNHKRKMFRLKRFQNPPVLLPLKMALWQSCFSIMKKFMLRIIILSWHRLQINFLNIQICQEHR